MKIKKFDSYDGVCFFNGLVFFAPVALLVRTQAGVSESAFFLLQALVSGVIFLGEIPTGLITDRIGYKKTLLLAQILTLAARALLLLAYFGHSMPLFVAEAVVEGVAACFSSGTGSAYLYDVYGGDAYLVKTARAANCGTAGFLISTAAYALIYRFGGIGGLLTGTVATASASVVCALFLKKETPKTNVRQAGAEENRASLRNLAGILRDGKALLFICLLSTFSVSWVLVNFFYAEKLSDCGLPVEWLSAVILGYSAIQMLAEPILQKLSDRAPKERGVGRETVVFTALAGMAMILFGNAGIAPLVLALMLVLPLLLNLPEYLLAEQENRLVDGRGGGENRAAALSVLNMGTNAVDIAALCASAVLGGIGVRWCFVAVGAFMILLAAAFRKKA